MFCRKCGKEIVDGSVYCSFCGAEQAPEEEQAEVYQAEKAEPPSADSAEEPSSGPGQKRSLLHTFIIAFNILVVIACLSIILVVLAQWISPRGKSDASSSAPALSSSQMPAVPQGTTFTTTTSRATTTAPKPTAKSGTVLYKDNKVTIRFEDVTRESWYGDYVIVFSVENKTNQTLTFQAESMALDGISLSSSKWIMSDEVAPQSTGRIYLKTEESVPLEPKKISGELHVIDFESDDYSNRSYNAKFVNVSLQ